jgi:hypothetical protein
MAIQTINYSDKSYINQNADIPDINKVNDTDMNEIKSVVNNNANEFTSYVNSQEIEDITSEITFNETITTNTSFIRKGKIIYVVIQGEGKTHAQNSVIATVPNEYKPALDQVFCPFVVNATTYGVLALSKTSGNLTVNWIGSTSASGRIYANFWYEIE